MRETCMTYSKAINNTKWLSAREFVSANSAKTFVSRTKASSRADNESLCLIRTRVFCACARWKHRAHARNLNGKMAGLREGATFRSCAEFEAAVAEYSRENHIVMVKRDSRTVESASAKARSAYPAGFTHIHMQFVCKHFGNRKSESRGIRLKQS